MRKLYLWLGMVIVASMVLAACGGGAPAAPAAEEAAPAAEEAAPDGWNGALPSTALAIDLGNLTLELVVFPLLLALVYQAFWFVSYL